MNRFTHEVRKQEEWRVIESVETQTLLNDQPSQPAVKASSSCLRATAPPADACGHRQAVTGFSGTTRIESFPTLHVGFATRFISALGELSSAQDAGMDGS